MLLKRIIPCLDVDQGRVVKGTNFIDIRDAGDPVELAARYDREGADEVVFLDITASHEKRDTIVELARHCAEELFIPFTIGGGIRSEEDVRSLLGAGADKVSLNSAAIKDLDLIGACARRFGSQCVVVAIDAKREGSSWKVYTHGGRRRTDKDAIEWAAMAQDLGAGEILLTSMDADGTKDGYDLPLTEKVAEEVDIPVIASGGCGNAQHIYEVLSRTGAEAALAASIFHYGELTVKQVKDYLRERGVPVR